MRFISLTGASARSSLCALLALTLVACDGPTTPPPSDAGPVLGVASTAQINAFEGQARFVTVLSASPGELLDGATVEAEDPAGALEILEQRCAGGLCAVVARVRDQTPNTGTAIPRPIDAIAHFLRVRRTTDPDLRALVNVYPLDVLTGGGATTVRAGGVRLASGVRTSPGSTLAGEPGGEPIRWVVFGDATLEGTLDVSAQLELAGPGGGAGGGIGAAGDDPTGGARGGAAGPSGAGGGGGGHLEAGVPGDGAGGELGLGGAAGAAGVDPSCLGDFARATCGGGGGGGGSAASGGGGGGGALLVVLGRMDATGATVLARGGDGAGGGGGGGGGALLLAASSWTAPSFDVGGGAGEALGGAGGAGLAIVQVPSDGPSGAAIGAAVDVGSVPSITSAATVVLSGRASVGGAVIVERMDDGTRASGTADGSGTFAIEVALAMGLNRFRVFSDDGGGEVRSWVGTSIEQARGDAGVLPVGALVDVARVD